MHLEPRVSIIVLNWNNYRDTLECLESLYQIDYTNYCIIVVDNGSKNDSVQKILQYAGGRPSSESKLFEDGLHNKPTKVAIYKREEITGTKIRDKAFASLNKEMVLIKNEKNYGFAEGNNIGIQFAMEHLEPDYVLLLNNDTVVDKQFLGELIEIADEEARIGILGPKIYYYDFSGRKDVIDYAGEDIVLWKAQGVRYGFNEPDRGQHDEIREVDKVDGACMLIKKSVLENVGKLDPTFFLCWEETDFCMRAKRKGYKLIYVPRAKIWHKIVLSVGSLRTPDRTYYYYRNRFLFAKKNLRGHEKMKFLIYFIGYSLWLEIAAILIRRQSRTRLIPYFKGTYSGLRRFLS